MSYRHPDSECALEDVTIRLFEELGWETANCYHETFGLVSALGRETTEKVVLEQRLRAAIEKLNPGLSPNTVELAVDELVKDRSTLSPVRANQEVHRLLKDGIRVISRRGDDDEEFIETVRVIARGQGAEDRGAEVGCGSVVAGGGPVSRWRWRWAGDARGRRDHRSWG